MKKGFLTLLLCFIAVTVGAQVEAPRVPTPQSNGLAGMQWMRSRPVASASGFVTDVPFCLPEVNGIAPRFAKSVGDGAEIMGSVISAYNWPQDIKNYGIYSLNATKGFKVNTIKLNGDMDSSSAVYADGFYYTWKAEIWFEQVFYIAWRKYDANTWNEIELEGNPAAEYKNVPFTSAITHDVKSGNVYAITFNDDGSAYRLSTMNMEDGSFDAVADIERPMIALAANAQGELYGISAEGDLYSINKADATLRLIGSTGKTPKYAQSIAFDLQTGKLYWAFINDEESALYEVNTKTASVYKIDNMPNGEEFVGLFVKNTPVVDAAPAAVTDLKFVPSTEGSATGTISCKAPTTTQNGAALSGQVKVTIYSGDEVLAEQSVAPGAVVTKENVTFNANQLYTLYAVASNQAGASAKASVTVFVGKDEAGVPSDVKLIVADKTATLTWKAPTKGLHDGYFDSSSISYKIVRFLGAGQGVEVGNTLPGVTTFSETLPSATGFYRYQVISMFENRAGGAAYSNAELSVGAYELPFFDDFSDGDLCKKLYTFLDLDNDKTGDGSSVCNTWYWKADEKLVQICVDRNAPKKMNDWMITPAIHFDAKNLYNLTYAVNMGAPSNWRVTLGTSVNPKDHVTIIDEHRGEKIQYQDDCKATFKVPADGVYYLGFYSDTDENGFYFNLFNIKVEAGMSAQVPDSVSNFKVVAASDGVKRVNISFNAPEAEISGTPLNGTFKVELKRDNVLLKSFDVTKGQFVTYVDESPVAGNNTYTAVTVANDKTGLAASRTVWAGYDQPEAVRNMTAVAVDKNMHVKLTWEAPTKGVNDGYFDISKVTYSVWRGLDKNKFDRIASGLKVFEYVDTEIEKILAGKQDAYYYAVSADVEDVISQATAKYIVVGTPYEFPSYESFANGKFRVTPWTTESIEGSFGFECMKRDRDAGMNPQDADKGFAKFYNPGWGDDVIDSRLKTPVFSLDGSKNPSFSFFMYHWPAKDVEADNSSTLCKIEISVDGAPFKQIGTDYIAGYEEGGWIEHRISLAEFKDAGAVQFGIRGISASYWMYFYIDNIRIEEQCDYDLSVSDFHGTSGSAEINEIGAYNVTYFNRGLKDAANYTVDLYYNDNLVASQQGETLKPGEMKTVTLNAPITSNFAGQVMTVKAVVNYEADELSENNVSPAIEVSVKSNWYPVVENLKGAFDGKAVELTWNAPVIPTDRQPLTDGAEDYEPFAISGFGGWLTVDGDVHGCGSLSNLPEYANKGKDQAWQIWAPGYLTGVTPEDYPLLQPRTGEQAFISWYANTSIDFDDPFNKDYLISPQVCAGSEVSFWIRRIGKDVDENYQIMYSTTTQEADQFKVLREGTADKEWTEEKFTLPEDARYFAICYIGRLQSGIMVDDVTYLPAVYDLKIEGYNIFRNGIKLNTELLKEPVYVDNNVKEDDAYAYQVAVVYNFGESDACDAVNVTCSTGIDEVEAGTLVYAVNGAIRVTTSEVLPVAVYSIDGKAVAIAKVDGVKEFAVESGIYVVKAGHKVVKVSVNK